MNLQNGTVKVTINDPTKESTINLSRLEMAVRLKKTREESRHTIISFAMMCGVTKQTQIAYEKGKRDPDANYFRRLNTDLSIDVAWLITGVASLEKLTAEEAATIDRYKQLPKKIKNTIDDVLLLAVLAYRDRRGYHTET